MLCTDTSHPDAVGFAFKSMFEAPADPLFEKYLSANSSQHLEYHYSSVRDSLNPVQLAGFDQSLRDTIGGNGTVVYGGVGVMALALAMLFDVLAAQVKGQKTLADPIQQIFYGEGKALSNMRTAISDCLDRLPRGATVVTQRRCGWRWSVVGNMWKALLATTQSCPEPRSGNWTLCQHYREKSCAECLSLLCTLLNSLIPDQASHARLHGGLWRRN